MRKLFLLVAVIFLIGTIFCMESEAAKKSKKGGISEQETTQMSQTIDNLTKKMYAHALYSPEDNSNLIDVKIKLDNQMLVAPDPSLAPLYFKLGIIYKSRGMKDEAIDCFQTILENFTDTALAPKATAQLKLMGVEINPVETPGASNGNAKTDAATTSAPAA